MLMKSLTFFFIICYALVNTMIACSSPRSDTHAIDELVSLLDAILLFISISHILVVCHYLGNEFVLFSN